MNYDIEYLEECGIDIQTGLRYTGGQNKYIGALQRYHNSYEKNIAKIEDFLSKSDIENYTIVVHALKSNSKMIGAGKLSAMFEQLEMAGKANDIEKIKSATEATLREYKTLIDKLSPIGMSQKVDVPDEISADEARKTSEDLLTALDDYDDELSLKLASKLAGYPFRLTQKDLLSKAIELIKEFLYDEAADIIREISATIE